MADSIRRQILDDLRTTLRSMTTGGGYNYTVTSSSVTLDPVKNLLTEAEGDGPWYMIEPVPEGGFTYNPALQINHRFRVNITGKHFSDPSDPDGKVDVWEKIIQDIETVLALDLTRSGLVVDTRLAGEPSPFVGVGMNVVLVVIPVEMHLHRTYGSP